MYLYLAVGAESELTCSSDAGTIDDKLVASAHQIKSEGKSGGDRTVGVH